MKNATRLRLLSLLLSLALLTGCQSAGFSAPAETSGGPAAESAARTGYYTLETLPDYAGSPYVALENNQPDFDESLFDDQSYEFYTDLDQLGRCGTCYANIGPDLMPTEERESISSVHPSGWVQAEYDFVDGKNLYNRCHLIGFQLTGENANDHNLITGTRYLNVEGMLPFENQVAEYIRDTGNHVLYRVTPDFQDSELVARGVELEAASVEDDTVRFHVYCYNVQPGVEINYLTGESRESGEAPAEITENAAHAAETGETETGEVREYVLNVSNKKFHLPNCPSVQDMKPENRQAYTGTREDLIAEGYSPCGRCKP